MAFLLGIAIGVMGSLSILEMYLHNAMQNGFAGVTIASVSGAVVFYLINPYFPEFDVSTFNEQVASFLQVVCITSPSP